MKRIKKLLLCFLAFLCVLFLFAIGYYLAVTNDAVLMDEKLLLNEQSVLLYDENGAIVQGATSFIRQTARHKDIPKHTKEAFIAVEDKRFFSHRGFDYKRIAAATLRNIKARAFKEGASTISQQLVKNTHLTQEKTLKRKLREWKLTRQLEKRYSKEEILEKYLNSIYFGHGCFGIVSAADFYFGKTQSELTLADSAILAGSIQSPNHYSPFKNPTRAKTRKTLVLALMQENGFIDEKARTEAENAPLPLPNEKNSGNPFARFVFDELSELAEKKGFQPGGKIEIYTALDQNLQAELTAICNENRRCDCAAFVLDNQKGVYKACLSTIGNAARLPGSLIKPLAVYAPSIEENLLSPVTPILDERVNFGGYSPQNYDGKYHGYLSARACLEKSLNVPAVKTLQTLGASKAAAYLRKTGLCVEKEDETLALALGGVRHGFPFKDVIAAYASFANGGVYSPCGFIERLKINGKTAYVKPTTKTRVFSEETAYLTTDMLRGVAKQGTAKKLRALPFDLAAKTGTVGTSKGNTDAYALAYTPLDTIGIWFGNADNTVFDVTGGGEPCSKLLRLFEIVGAKRENPSFPLPKNVVRVSLDKTAYESKHEVTLADDLAPREYVFSELFKTTHLPKTKSTRFSSPEIDAPTLTRTEEGAVLTFPRELPEYYTYEIDRYDFQTHTLLYRGEGQKTFVDGTIEADKRYVYTVTPYFGERKGTPVVLPILSTGSSKRREGILEKEWWKY